MVSVGPLREIRIYNMEIDKTNIPEHIAIIMDGNGRWAKKKFLPRALGHREGVKAVERTLEAAGRLGVKYLTLYAFSTENWSRPQEEINALMGLLAKALDNYKDKLNQNEISLKIIGAYKDLPESVVTKLDSVMQATSHNSKMTLVLALNYSGQWEITEAMRKIAEKTTAGKMQVEDINSKTIESELDTSFAPAPELIIRTSGEQRISNFLLWQSAYSELYFTSELWPDFDEKSLIVAVKDYQARERRFGGVK